ncbi:MULTISPECIES: FAD-dependent oxidoreductase [unclassified Microbacterium]|uniref:FAD-dependent oxidoreductase n=1 Tax=unclassified Microbacterium TaxID=2609290 RepID=UPI000EA84A1D|nr:MULTISPECIES: FAD-dependent oxidoreductase [unclassified Microbacterium]MBT2485084.1 FAD-dependent oxidoreductase [Microbacterium sp. ISL-108]RKN67928.1 FAD-dependent oxidoreductase [Microbacterium sp. CGR2]
METDAVDVAVVGGGVMGLATAWELTRRGLRPVVLEQFARGHHQGASHGATRNFNNAYAEEHYLDLLMRSREGWDTLGPVDGEPLLRLHGLVTHGRLDVAAVRDRLVARGIAAELLTATGAATRWPGMRFEGVVLWSSDAGVIRASDALRALEQRIIAGGGEVRWRTPVAHIGEDAKGVVLALANGSRVHADTAVVTAGAWSSELLGRFGLPRLTVTEETPAHFRPGTDSPWPSFNHYVDPDRHPATVYGMPTPGEGVKVGFHGVGDQVDPDGRPHRATHQQALSEYVREWLPGLDAASAVPISCTYTSTDDGTFVLDRRGRTVVGAGFSGHGFKFATGIGAVLADLALDPGARAAEPFRLS